MADIVALGDGRFAVTDGTRTRIAYAATDGAHTWVFFDGRSYVVREARGSARQGRDDDQAALTAPMPATVVGVAVEPGARVAKGDVLLTLEAMKMELPVRAPRDGVVRRIACRAGDLVQPGIALVELE